MEWTSFLTPTIGATGLLALVVVMIFRGSLVPRSTVDQMRADKDQQIEMWKAAYERLETAVTTKDQQITALMDASRTTTQVLQAVHMAAGSNSGRSAHVPAEE